MKKILVIGNSLNGAFNAYINSEKYTSNTLFNNTKFDIFSINGRAFLRDALVSPFIFSSENDSEINSIKFINTMSDTDGEMVWFCNSGKVDEPYFEMCLDNYQGLIINEILLWSIFPKTIECGYYVPSTIKIKHNYEKMLSNLSPISESMYYFGLRSSKVNSFKLLDNLIGLKKRLPVFVMPGTMPRLDQTMYDDLFRLLRFSEIEFLRGILESEFKFTTLEMPNSTKDSPFSIKANLTNGDIHHYNQDFVHEVFEQEVFQNWIYSLVQ